MTSDRPLELLHMDLFGLIAYISIDESKYCLVIVDDYSRFTWDTREPGRWKRAGNRELKMVSELRGRRARALVRDGCAR